MASPVFIIDSNNCLTALCQTDYDLRTCFKEFWQTTHPCWSASAGRAVVYFLCDAKLLFLLQTMGWVIGPWTTSLMETVFPFL